MSDFNFDTQSILSDQHIQSPFKPLPTFEEQPKVKIGRKESRDEETAAHEETKRQSL